MTPDKPSKPGTSKKVEPTQTSNEPTDLSAPSDLGTSDERFVQRLDAETVRPYELKQEIPADKLFLSDNEKVSPDDQTEQGYAQKENALKGQLPKIILIGVVIQLIVGVVIYFNYRSNQEELESDPEFSFSPKESVTPSPLSDEDLTKKARELRETVINYCQSPSPEVRSQYCRPNPQLLKRMHKHYAEVPFQRIDVLPEDIWITGSNMNRGQSYYSVVVKSAGVGSFGLALCETPSGIRVDWESSVIWQEHDWQEISAMPPGQKIEVRVSIQPDNFFIAPFTKSDHLCLRVKSPGLEQSAYAYVKSGSPSFKALQNTLSEWLSGNRFVQKCILTLETRSPISEILIFEVKQVVSETWVKTDAESASRARITSPKGEDKNKPMEQARQVPPSAIQ